MGWSDPCFKAIKVSLTPLIISIRFQPTYIKNNKYTPELHHNNKQLLESFNQLLELIYQQNLSINASIFLY